MKSALDAGSTTMLDEKSAAVLANSDIHIINIGEDNAITSQAENPLAGVKDYLTKTPAASNFGKIISFATAYVKDNSVFVNKY